MKINKEFSVEQHASWLASNPVVGCPMDCAYCFLRPEGLTKTKPQILFTPKEALDDLINSPLYTETIPVATGTRTDYFSTPEVIKYLSEYIIQYTERKLKNPLILITKKKIPDGMITLFKELQDKGTIFIFFLSYSGIDERIEKGVNHLDIKDNFRRLSEAGLMVVHYWRPFIPENSTEKIMNEVFHRAMSYAGASVVTGLKLTKAMKNQFWFWKDIQELDVNLSDIEGIWPKGVRESLTKMMSKFPEYPLGYASSCAIATTLKIPDYNGFYNTEVCKANSCKESQRNICKRFYTNHEVSDVRIKEAFARLMISDVLYKIDNTEKLLTLHKPLDHSKIVNLTQTLRVKVVVKESEDDNYGWGSSVAQRKPYDV